MRAIALSLALLAGPAQAASVSLPVSLAGLPVGKMDYQVALDGRTYTITGIGRTGGIARLASSASSTFTSKGALGQNGPVPTSHSVRYREDKKEGSASIAFRNGRVASVKETPPPTPRKDRTKVTKAMLRGAVDPVSAMIVPAGPKVSLATICDRTIKISDARNVFTLALSPSGSGKLKDGTRTHTCAVRYTPLGGHRASSKGVKRVAENRSLRMTFAPLNAEVWGVVGFRFKSRFGTVRSVAKGVGAS